VSKREAYFESANFFLGLYFERVRIFRFFWILSGIWLVTDIGCVSHNDRISIDVSKVDVPAVKIHRYDLDLFKVRPGFLRQDLEKLKPGYRFFLDTDLNDSSKIQQIKIYLETPRNIDFHAAVQARFKDVTFLETSIREAFRHVKFYYPGVKIPRVYTYISGGDYDFPVQLADSVLLIGLDNYLGKDFKAFMVDGIPLYRIARMTPDYILPQVLKVMQANLVPEPLPGNNLLEQMIEGGRRLYFVQAMIPQTDPRFIIGYSVEQYEWIINNEAPVWSAIIENQILYSTDGRIIRSFMADGPFTPEFSKEAPSRLGEFLGWQIVKNYMENEPQVTLPQMMAEKDFQKILTLSKYKPKK
jgi:hypothetical protein